MIDNGDNHNPWQEQAEKKLNQLAEYTYENMCLIQDAPRRPLYAGGAGIAYTFWKAACALDDPRWLHQARFWIDHVMVAPEDDEYIRADDTSEAVGERMHIKDSFYIGNRGISMVKGLVSHAEDNRGLLDIAMTEFTAPETERIENQELLEGIAGRLVGSAILLRETARDQLKGHGDSLAADLLGTTGHTDDRLPWNNVKYYGMAHGHSGNYYAVLRWAKESGWQPPDWFYDQLIRFGRTARRHEHGLGWPRSDDEADRFINSWCHGAPGHTLLWSLAYEVYGEPFFLELARSLGKTCASQREHIAGHLCCGAAGVAYAMLALNRIDPDGKWFDEAKHYTEVALKAALETKFRLSLFRGLAGQTCLMLDMANPSEAAFPALG